MTIEYDPDNDYYDLLMVSPKNRIRTIRKTYRKILCEFKEINKLNKNFTKGAGVLLNWKNRIEYNKRRNKVLKLINKDNALQIDNHKNKPISPKNKSSDIESDSSSSCDPMKDYYYHGPAIPNTENSQDTSDIDSEKDFYTFPMKEVRKVLSTEYMKFLKNSGYAPNIYRSSKLKIAKSMLKLDNKVDKIIKDNHINSGVSPGDNYIVNIDHSDAKKLVNLLGYVLPTTAMMYLLFVPYLKEQANKGNQEAEKTLKEMFSIKAEWLEDLILDRKNKNKLKILKIGESEKEMLFLPIYDRFGIKDINEYGYPNIARSEGEFIYWPPVSDKMAAIRGGGHGLNMELSRGSLEKFDWLSLRLVTFGTAKEKSKNINSIENSPSIITSPNNPLEVIVKEDPIDNLSDYIELEKFNRTANNQPFKVLVGKHKLGYSLRVERAARKIGLKIGDTGAERCGKKYIGNIVSSQGISLNLLLGGYTLTPKEFFNFVNLLKSGNAVDGLGKNISELELSEIYTEITGWENKDTLVGEFLDTSFIKKDGEYYRAYKHIYLNHKDFTLKEVYAERLGGVTNDCSRAREKILEDDCFVDLDSFDRQVMPTKKSQLQKYIAIKNINYKSPGNDVCSSTRHENGIWILSYRTDPNHKHPNFGIRHVMILEDTR